MEPLIAILQDSDLNVRSVAAETLGKIGDTRQAEPLLVALKDDNWKVRRAVAKILVELYHSGNLSEKHKHLILAQRQQMIGKHTDGTKIFAGKSISYSDCGGHTDNAIRKHQDTGIGIDFPI